MRSICMALLTAALLVLLSTPAVAFPDVPVSQPYALAIDELAARGIVDGRKDGTFGPDDPVWRAQFAKMIVGTVAIGVDEEDDLAPFTDLGPDDADDLSPHEYVAAAYSNGITYGKTATAFAPYEDISRAQVITMVVRAIDRLYPGLLQEPSIFFADSWGNFSPAHAANARKAEYNLLLDGLGRADPETRGRVAGLDPWGVMPRGEVAQVLWNVITLPDQLQTGGRVVNPRFFPRADFFDGYVDELMVELWETGDPGVEFMLAGYKWTHEGLRYSLGITTEWTDEAADEVVIDGGFVVDHSRGLAVQVQGDRPVGELEQAGYTLLDQVVQAGAEANILDGVTNPYGFPHLSTLARPDFALPAIRLEANSAEGHGLVVSGYRFILLGDDLDLRHYHEVLVSVSSKPETTDDAGFARVLGTGGGSAMLTVQVTGIAGLEVLQAEAEQLAEYFAGN